MTAPQRRKILFLCTGNACRSQMAEAMLQHLAGDRFEALSAGSHPAGYVHWLAIETLERLGIPIGEARSKSWDEFANTPLDVVITVCDYAANGACPTWPGTPIRAHWPLPDPASHVGTEDECSEFAVRVGRRLLAKIEGLVALDWSRPDYEVGERLGLLGQI